MGELIVLGKNCHHHYIPVLLSCLRYYTIFRVCFIQLKLKSRFSSSQKKKKKKMLQPRISELFPLLLECV